jgi:transcriptional regulator with XRE-family HTH domain
MDQRDHEPLLAALVRDKIRRARTRYGCATDAELAAKIGILPKYISGWQNNRFTHLDRALAGLLLECPSEPETTP